MWNDKIYTIVDKGGCESKISYDRSSMTNRSAVYGTHCVGEKKVP